MLTVRRDLGLRYQRQVAKVFNGKFLSADVEGENKK